MNVQNQDIPNEQTNQETEKVEKRRKSGSDPRMVIMFAFSIVLLVLPFLTMFIYALALGAKATKIMRH